MKKILGIHASPRKISNCELLIKETARHLPNYELQIIALHDLKLLPCKACYRCLFKAGKCKRDDSLPTVIEALCKTDMLIVAAPTYMLGANSSLKLLLDRTLPLYHHLDELWGKPALAYAVAGMKGKEGSCLLDVERFINLSFFQCRGRRVIYGALPGEVFLDEDNLETVKEMAQALQRHRPDWPSPHCPLCGGDTFRFLDDSGAVRCMACSNSGHIHMSENRIRVSIAADEHELFLSKEAARKHGDWLRAQFSLFRKKRVQLREITAAFR